MIVKYLKTEHPEQWKKAEDAVPALLEKVSQAVEDERALKDVKRQWPPLELAKWEWEFLRRSRLFQAECAKISNIGPWRFLRDRWEFVAQAHVFGKNDNIPRLCYVFDLIPPRIMGAEAFFTQYRLDFRALLTAWGALALLPPDVGNAARILQAWASDFTESRGSGYRGIPGNLISMTYFPPNWTISGKNHRMLAYFELVFTPDLYARGVECLCVDLPVFEFGRRDDGGEGYARIAVPGCMPWGEDEAGRDATYKKVVSTLVEEFGRDIPSVSSGAEMRPALYRQIEELDFELGWKEAPKRGAKDIYSFRAKKSADKKIKYIESAAKRRMKAFPAK